MTECPRCLGPLDADGTCPIRERVRAERVAQGLPPTVTDPATLDRIAVLVAPAFRALAEQAAREQQAALDQQGQPDEAPPEG